MKLYEIATALNLKCYPRYTKNPVATKLYPQTIKHILEDTVDILGHLLFTELDTRKIQPENPNDDDRFLYRLVNDTAIAVEKLAKEEAHIYEQLPGLTESKYCPTVELILDDKNRRAVPTVIPLGIIRILSHQNEDANPDNEKTLWLEVSFEIHPKVNAAHDIYSLVGDYIYDIRYGATPYAGHYFNGDYYKSRPTAYPRPNTPLNIYTLPNKSPERRAVFNYDNPNLYKRLLYKRFAERWMEFQGITTSDGSLDPNVAKRFFVDENTPDSIFCTAETPSGMPDLIKWILMNDPVIQEDLKGIEFGIDYINCPGTQFYRDIYCKQDMDILLANAPTVKNQPIHFSVLAGSMTQHSVYIVFYLDDKQQLRAYMPTYGNLINHDRKTALYAYAATPDKMSADNDFAKANFQHYRRTWAFYAQFDYMALIMDIVSVLGHW